MWRGVTGGCPRGRGKLWHHLLVAALNEVLQLVDLIDDMAEQLAGLRMGLGHVGVGLRVDAREVVADTNGVAARAHACIGEGEIVQIA